MLRRATVIICLVLAVIAMAVSYAGCASNLEEPTDADGGAEASALDAPGGDGADATIPGVAIAPQPMTGLANGAGERIEGIEAGTASAERGPIAPQLTTPCTSDSNCPAGDYCAGNEPADNCTTNQGTCTPKQTNGYYNCTVNYCTLPFSPCQSGYCVDLFCCSVSSCGQCATCTSGTTPPGSCAPVPQGSAGSPSCGGYLCNGSSQSCPSSCTSDGACANGYYCDSNSQCVAQIGLGQACHDVAGGDCLQNGCRDCASGSCVDGVCCSTAVACTGTCSTCDGTSPGTCTALPKDSLGNPNKSPSSCSPYTCPGGSFSCGTTCASDNDCASGYYCNSSGQCAAQKPPQSANSCNLGTIVDAGLDAAGTDGGDCKVGGCRECNGFCVDGYCCNSACSGSCETCDQAGDQGSCLELSKDAPGNPARTPPSCAPYTCPGPGDAGATCATTCAADTDCAAGFYCAANATCQARKAQGSTCNLATDCEVSGSCSECASGTCANGYCCNVVCNIGQCEACNGGDSGWGVANGTCKAAPLGYSPAPGGCANGFVCDGADITCPTQCVGSQECVGADYCNSSNQCIPRQANGTACTSPNDCLNDFCADGYCCNAACAGPCDTCSVTPGTCIQAAKDAPGSPSCAPYTCPGGSDTCATTCASDVDCASGNYCDSSGQCVGQKSSSAAATCNLGTILDAGADAAGTDGGDCRVGGCHECVSNDCVDGYCCNSACSGTCDTCGAAPGTCTQLAKDSAGNPSRNPPNCGAYTCAGPGDAGDGCSTTCASDTDCAAGFFCNASGACAVQKSASSDATCATADCESPPCRECAAGNCVDGYCCNTACGNSCDACNVPGALGTCTVAPAGSPGTPACPSALCNGTSATCVSTCTADAQCEPGSFCSSSGNCVPQKVQGTCSTSAGVDCFQADCHECTSGFCVDGHCCGTSSCGSCQECTGPSGTCVAVTNAPDPDNCTGTKSCNASGVCETANGLSCSPNGPNAACASGFCVDGACCGTSSCGSCQECTGANGTCVTITGQPDPDNCSGAHICNASGGCALADGQACSPNGINQACASGNCVDGVCCAASACATCQQCNLSGNGTCSVVTNGPDLDSCTGTNTCNASGQCTLAQGQPCSAGASCASDFCIDGFCCGSACGGQCDVCSIALGAPLNGTCAVAPAGYAGSPSCLAFVCNGSSAACPTTCTLDTQCASGEFCGGGTCVAKATNGAACTAADQCKNGNCVDGFCCDAACSGACDTCSATPGTCTQLAKDTPGNGRTLADGGTETCAPYTCPGASDSCASACSSDAACAAGSYCDEDGVCQPQKAQGASCSNVAGAQCIQGNCRECASGSCVDGVCCGSAACGTCQACNLDGAGTCSAVTNAPDPDTCTGTQSCNASGQCEAATGQGCSSGSGCASGFCVTGVCCATACSGACDVCPSGACAQAALGYAPTPACANGLVCAGGSDSCPPGCTSDAQCVASDYCSAGSCTPRQPLGATCGATDQCQSGTCFDGVCCTAGCSGACSVCTVAHGAPATGTCTTAPLGYAGSPACLVFACNGSSTGCPSATTSQCGSDAACETGYYCGADATCHLKKTTGATCNVTAGADCLQASCGECASGGCVDGVCCSTSSCGSCEACDLAGSVGTCATVKNGPDPDNCTGVDTCDANGVCRSVDGQACASGGTCASTFCADGVCCTSACAGGCNFCNVTAEPCGPATAPFFCVSGQHCVNDVCVAGGDYTGTCTVTPNPSLGANPSCAPLLCNTTSGACPASCTSDANCEPGEYCSANGTCQVQKAAAAKCNDGAGQDCEVAGCRVCVEGAGSCADGYCCNTTCSGACNGCNGADLDWPAAVDGTCAVAPAGFSGNPSCGSYACDGHDTTCSSTCTSDVDCAASDYCASNGTCQPRKSQGAVCNDAAGQDCLTPTCRECTTGAGMCIDGFCCNATCSGSCNACDGATLGWAGALNGTCAIAPAGYAGAPSCSLSPTFSVCDGTQSTCEGACTTDAECASDGYCNSSGQCASKQALGAACTTGSGDQCTSGFCQDGVCCNTACAGTCQACAAILKESGAQDGICGATADGKAPHDDCVAAAPSSCKQNGLCNGLGACADYPSGTSCGTTACTAGNLETGFSCDGAGNCVQSAGGTTCAPYLCEGTACKTPCVTTSDCVGGNFCDNGTCKGLFTNGTACTAATAGSCSSGFCVEGVCCNSECNGTCQTCLATNQAAAADGGAPVNGTCGPVQAGLADPTGNCTNAGAASCGTNGLCTASGGCADFPGGTPCAATVCAGNAVQTSLCNGTGTCLSSASSCGSFACVGGSCNTTCQADSDCATGSWCNAGTCQVRAATGAACTLSDACVSQFCVDGVCCNNACNTTCQACAAGLKQSGTDDGICGPSAANTAPHQDCTADDHNSCEQDGKCDGLGDCALFALGTPCNGGNDTCVANALTSYECNGFGVCEVDSSSSTDCTPYACNAAQTTCPTSCTNDGGCFTGYYCDAGACTAQAGLGGACSAPDACGTGFCVDGVCCNTLCNGTCQTCLAANQVSGPGVADGTCGDAKEGIDPHSDCPNAGAASCLTDGECDGAGHCEDFAAGTTCADPTCTGNDPTTYACNGTGTCVQSVGQPCDPFLCGSGTCDSTCKNDQECGPTSWCNAGVCTPTSAQGATCTQSDQCSTNFCVDGFCCNGACNGTCEACAAALKTSASGDGECGPATAGSAESACTTDPKTSCQQDGTCDGSGNCRLYQQGTACGTNTACVGNVETGSACNGFGVCESSGTGVPCDPYICKGSACATPCQGDTDCVAGNYCASGTCTARIALGGACTPATANSCGSGFCVEGVCCNSACNGTCQSCLAKNQGPTADGGAPSTGTCGTAVAGFADLSGNCANQGTASCGNNGLCNGAGACADYPSGTSCGATVCAGSFVQVSLCNGTGTCLSTATTCGTYGCTGGVCKTTCATSADCAAGSYCDGTTCEPTAAQGVACTTNAACTSGICVDDVCCNSACDGQCEACNVPATLGTCTPVVGAPQSPRAACAAGTASSPCTQALCDGIHTTSCDAFVGSSVTCGAASCSDGPTTSSSQATGSCDGDGSCKLPAPSSCGTFACNGTACRTACTVDTDCAGSNKCDTSTSLCVSGSTCGTDGVTLMSPDGTTTDCAPFKCEGSACLTACKSVDDCASPAVCNTSGACVAPASNGGSGTSSSGGCGCETVGAQGDRSGGARWLGLLGLVAALAGARRRRHSPTSA